MNETVNQVTEELETEKTFTQAEVDAIIGDRLKRDRAKYADYEELKTKAARLDEIEEASKTELQKATERAAELQTKLDQMVKADGIRVMREKVASETGVPVELITAENEDDARKQAEKVIEITKPNSYPSVRDAGETVVRGKQSTKQQFAEWMSQNFN